MAVPSEIVPQDAESHFWDVIVIGTGAGRLDSGLQPGALGALGLAYRARKTSSS